MVLSVGFAGASSVTPKHEDEFHTSAYQNQGVWLESLFWYEEEAIPEDLFKQRGDQCHYGGTITLPWWSSTSRIFAKPGGSFRLVDSNCGYRPVNPGISKLTSDRSHFWKLNHYVFHMFTLSSCFETYYCNHIVHRAWLPYHIVHQSWHWRRVHMMLTWPGGNQ